MALNPIFQGTSAGSAAFWALQALQTNEPTEVYSFGPPPASVAVEEAVPSFNYYVQNLGAEHFAFFILGLFFDLLLDLVVALRRATRRSILLIDRWAQGLLVVRPRLQ